MFLYFLIPTLIAALYGLSQHKGKVSAQRICFGLLFLFTLFHLVSAVLMAMTNTDPSVSFLYKMLSVGTVFMTAIFVGYLALVVKITKWVLSRQVAKVQNKPK